MTHVGIIGAGHIGSAIARVLVTQGHQVAIANSRGPETLTDLVAELGENAQAMTAADAAAFGEWVLVTVPLKAIDDLPVAELAALGAAGPRDAIVWTAFAARAGTDPEVRAIHEREWRRTEGAVQALLADAYPDAHISSDDAAVLLAVLDGIAVARGAEGEERMPGERGRRLVAAVLSTFGDRG